MKYPILILLLLTIIKMPIQAQDNWTYHQCKASNKNYSPGHGLGLKRKADGYEFSFTIKPEDWYDPKVLENEAKDWLKAAGVSYFSFFRPATWAKNHLSALIGFRMKANQRFEVCAYVNDLAGGHRFDGVVDAAVGDIVRVTYRLKGNVAYYGLIHDGKVTSVSFKNFANAKAQISVGPWHGGSSPAPVRTGVWGAFRIQ
jgi:hypothetical protein